MSNKPESKRLGRTETVKRLLHYLAVSKAKTAAVVLLFVVGVFSFILVSTSLGAAIELLSGSPQAGELETITLVILGLSGLTFATLLAANLLLANLTQKAVYSLRKDVFNHLQRLSLNFFERQPIGELMSRLTSDIDAVSSFLQGPINTFILGVTMLIIIIAAQWLLNPTLALVASLTYPILIVLMIFLSRVAGPTFTVAQQKMSDLNGKMEEDLSGQRTILAYNRQAASSKELNKVSANVMEVAVKGQVLALFANPLSFMAVYIILAIIGLVGASMAIGGGIDVGTFVIFLTFSQLLLIPVYTIFNSYNYILQALAGSKRIFVLLDETPTVKDDPKAAPLHLTSGHVKFDSVDFSYVPKRKILKNVTFEAKPGQTIGLCGPTGAGKSTIINILTRYYDIDKGTVLIDDQNIRMLQQDSLRSQVGVVPQEPFLFSDTVINNIRYARENATDEECIEAAKKAKCHEFIMKLPRGYNTFLVDGGSNLSQGQRQLLTIARAMVANPKMLILDEATSNVDTRTERSIKEALNKLQQGRTSFVIAHRLSTIRNADLILYIENGEVAERGTHEQLMALRGKYHTLFISQYKGKLAEILPVYGKNASNSSNAGKNEPV